MGYRLSGREGTAWSARSGTVAVGRPSAGRLSPALGGLGGREVEAPSLAPSGGPGPALRAEAGEPLAVHDDLPAQLFQPLDGHGVGADREGGVGEADGYS